MLEPSRLEERFAVEVLRRELSATFTSFDDNSAPAMVDGLFVLPGGALGALEVTTLTGGNAMEFEALTLGTDWSRKIDGVEWFWAIWVSEGLDLKAAEEHLGVVFRACEAAGEHDLKRGAYLGNTPSHLWLRSQERGMHGYGSDSGKFRGLVQLIPSDPHAAFLSGDLNTEILSWLDSELRTEPLLAKIAKLEAAGRPERHLFLRIHESAPPDQVLHELAFGGGHPTRDVAEVHRLTGLWVVPRWGTPLRWLAEQGWARFELDLPNARRA